MSDQPSISVRVAQEQRVAELIAERRAILDSVTRHCTVEQINAITADTLRDTGRKYQRVGQPLPDPPLPDRTAK